MADSFTDITTAPAESPDLLLEAAIHLGYVEAIADIIRTLAYKCNNEPGELDELSPTTLESAMYCIAHHIDAVQAINVKLVPREP